MGKKNFIKLQHTNTHNQFSTKMAGDKPEKKQNGLTKPLNLSPELAAIVGAKKDEKLARSEVVKRLWAYLKAQNLQDPENKQYFTPDEKMAPVFGTEKIKAFGMAKYLKTHLSN